MSGGFKVLLVEDDEIISETVKKFLEASGYVVETAIHGAHAFEKLRASPVLPSLILLDFTMPVMSGPVFLEKLRAESEDYARIPVLLMTALPNVKVDGVAGVLTKPFTLKEILERVRAFHKG